MYTFNVMLPIYAYASVFTAFNTAYFGRWSSSLVTISTHLTAPRPIPVTFVSLKLEFHGTDTDTDIDTDILADFR